MKSVCIRRFSGPYSPAFGLNTERYSVSLRIKSEYGKIRTRKTANTDTFHALCIGYEGIFSKVAAQSRKRPKSFSNETNREYLISKFSNETLNSETLDKFLGIYIDVLNQYGSCKTEMLRGNQIPFMNNELSKAICPGQN